MKWQQETSFIKNLSELYVVIQIRPSIDQALSLTRSNVEQEIASLKCGNTGTVVTVILKTITDSSSNEIIGTLVCFWYVHCVNVCRYKNLWNSTIFSHCIQLIYLYICSKTTVYGYFVFKIHFEMKSFCLKDLVILNNDSIAFWILFTLHRRKKPPKEYWPHSSQEAKQTIQAMNSCVELQSKLQGSINFYPAKKRSPKYHLFWSRTSRRPESCHFNSLCKRKSSNCSSGWVRIWIDPWSV